MNDRKPCPFCGCLHTEFETWPIGRHQAYRVMCTACGSLGGKSLSAATATESWNMRREVPSSVQADADAHKDVRNATPEELLEATAWFYQETLEAPGTRDRLIAFLRLGFRLAQPGGWEQVAPIWLRESQKIAALDD